MRAAELAKLCGAKLEGDGELELTDVARVEKASRSQVCFVANAAYLGKLEKCQAGAVIARPGTAVPQGITVLRHDDPDAAFSKVVGALRPEPDRPAAGISEKAAIGKRFEMGEGSAVGHYCVIGDGVKLGRNVTLYPHCVIGDDVEIGDNTTLWPRVTVLERCKIGARCTLHPGAVIGGDGFGYHFVNGHFEKAPQRGDVAIEDDVEIGANTTVDRARFDTTTIRKGSKIDNLVQIAHNCNIGQNCVVAGLSGLSGSVTLKDYVMLGGNVGVADHLTIGMGAKIAAKSGIMKDVPPGMQMAGLPADEGRAFMKREAAVRKLPELTQKVRRLTALVKKLAEKAGVEIDEDDL